MAISVSKINALAEMVRAFDSNEIKKSNKIGKVLCKNIQKDAMNKGYSEYIQLDRDTKQLFPVKIRKQVHQKTLKSKNTKLKIITEGGIYEFIFEDEVRVVHKV